jgi:hypothetical protein
VKHLEQLKQFSPSKRPNTPQKRGYYIDFEPLLDPKTPVLSTKTTKKRQILNVFFLFLMRNEGFL